MLENNFVYTHQITVVRVIHTNAPIFQGNALSHHHIHVIFHDSGMNRPTNKQNTNQTHRGFPYRNKTNQPTYFQLNQS